ncbi:hypothetical protein BLNAU_7619 [Blattamonas nauphoetae]|uniref:Cation-dependent mannose-6-phosphate receptor n=1 Tax=Blattamonas nauphoetae TaxID=2049346 RepID=A0ABQ9Y146_9EUKA|nr:hypothetical protein BLNAU_7619 [Blattamonas nauphoetae]
MLLILLISSSFCKKEILVVDGLRFRVDGLTLTDSRYNVTLDQETIYFNFRAAVLPLPEKGCEYKDQIAYTASTNAEQKQECWGLGTVDSGTAKKRDKNQGVMFRYEKSDDASSFNLAWICSDKTNIVPSKVSLEYTVNFMHPNACPLKDPPSFGIIFWIIILIAAAAYFIIGTPISIFVFKKRGKEMILFFKYWKQGFGYVKDGVRFLFSPCVKTRNYYEEVS